MSTTFAYAAEIVKSERDENGDLLVYGKATGPDLDLDGQICDPTWLKSAMPAWMEWGNVREMHQPIAAGIGVELESIGDSWWLKSKCIDPSTALKIESGVLKGYSVGIKSPKVVKDASAPGGRIVGGDVVEVSYVDRPCNPTAKMTICKSAPTGDAAELQPVERIGTPEAQAITQHVEEERDAEPDPAEHPIAEDGTENPAEPVEQPAEPYVPTAVGGQMNDDGSIDSMETAVSKNVGRDVLRRVRRLVPVLATLSKAAPSEDIASAQEAITCIARLIESEAQGLAAGMACEAYQIRTLLSAIESLQWFCEMESGETGMVELSAKADGQAIHDTMITKTPAAEHVAAATKTIDESTMNAAISKAVTEATEGLRAQLAKVQATPIPGGPVLARPTQAIAEAEGRGTALAKAAHYEALAAQMRGTDNAAVQGYLDLARVERAKIAA